MTSRGQGTKKARSVPAPKTDNLLESLRDIGGSGLDSVKKDIFQGIPGDFTKQLFGFERPPAKASGEIAPGQSLDIDAVLEGQKAENQVLRARLQQEQSLREQEKVLFAQKSQDLKMELGALVQEVGQLAKTTQGLSKEVQIATIQAPANPGIYHVIFFEKLREFIQSFRKKIENASLWLQSYNQRAAKRRTFWGQVGQSGSKRLLSPEDYLQRSAG